MEIKKFVPLTTFNTFRITSEADSYVSLTEEKELNEIHSHLKLTSSKYLVLGKGSNILLPEIFKGLVIHNNLPGIKALKEDSCHVLVKAGGGLPWDSFVEECIDRNWYGLENLSYIPGTVGASPVQNISAYGVEVGEFIDFVEVFDIETGKRFALDKNECSFSYRNSIFKNKTNLLVTSVIFRLLKRPKLNLTYRDIAERIKEKNVNDFSAGDLRNLIIDIRKHKLPEPDLIPNAGSFFHNPIVDKTFAESFKRNYDIPVYEIDSEKVKLSAGWLIENAGLKGFRKGNVGIYDKHALVLVNYGTATQKEILDFSKFIKSKVYSKFKVSLNIEPIIVN